MTHVSTSELAALLEVAVDFAREAGDVTLQYFQKSYQLDRKADQSYVTIADRAAERLLRERIEARFPEDGILGEEEGERRGTSNRRWIIDPIDGTYTFVHGVPLYGVLVGLEIDGEPSVGVINLPALGDMVAAARGCGCFWNNRRAHVSATATLDDALLLCTDFGTCDKYGFGEAAAALVQKSKSRRTWGDCYGYALVATGRADVMLDPVMNVWDCAALLPIIEEAGGTFTDWHGRRTINSGNAVATNGKLFDQVMATIAFRNRS